MADDSVKDRLASKVKVALVKNGIKHKIAEVTIQDSDVKKGENVVSKTHWATVKFEDADTKPLNLFMKSRTADASHTALVKESMFFEKEAAFFRDYIPAADEFCASKGQGKLMDVYPKFYDHGGDDDCAIFENLVLDKGFAVLDKTQKQDFEAARFALTFLAKHHAISYALLKEMKGPKAFFERFRHLDFEVFDKGFCRTIMEPAMETGILTSITLMEEAKIEGRRKATVFLKSCIGKVFDKALGALIPLPEEEKLMVLNHGDFWGSNMMFRKDKSGKLIDHVPLDFQVTRYSSPCVDLGYYLYTTVKPEVRRERLQEMLTLYLDVLNKTTSDLGCPMELSFEELFANYRKKFRVGFWFGFPFATGAGHAVFNGVDAKNLKDLELWAELVGKVIQKWIDENVDRCEENAKIILDLMTEYLELSGE